MTSNRYAPPPENLRAFITRVMDPDGSCRGARLFRAANIAVIFVGLLGVVLATDPTWGTRTDLLIILPLLTFIVEYGLRLWTAPERMARHTDHPHQARWLWAKSRRGLADLLGAVLVPAAWLAGAEPDITALFGVLWVLKLARYSQGLHVLSRVIQLEAEPLIGVLFAFLVVLLCASVLVYLLEGRAQPQSFGTVPKALWWTIVTLTTTGYGDMTPITPLGRMLAGLVMMSGIVVFALWAGVLATGFTQEMRRRAFLKTWDLVARVPLFHDVGAAVIADVVQRLRPRDAASGTVVVRKGEIGDCMYFIVSGEIVVQLAGHVLRLRDGDFFGEMALISGGRRNATAVASRPTQLLSLDIMDFRDLASRHPQLTQAIHDEAERRRLSKEAKATANPETPDPSD
ncbi:MAG: cyclic nucleotide-gated ion channel [Rhodospirillaceae bacterium]